MSNVLFPTLPGITFEGMKAPELNTQVQRSVNLSELRASFTSTPVWNFGLQCEMLRDEAAYPELHTLAGFFLARFGKWDSWLYADPMDKTATAENFGTGDGTTTAFQLRRTWGAFGEPCHNVAAAPSIYKAGVLQASGYTINSTGLVTFAVAPTAGQALTWSGMYYFRCRFKEDVQEYEQFLSRMWQQGRIEFVGCLGSKI